MLCCAGTVLRRCVYRKRQHVATILDTQAQKSCANGNNQGTGRVQTSEDILEPISHGGHRSHKNLIHSKYGCSCQHLPGLRFFLFIYLKERKLSDLS